MHPRLTFRRISWKWSLASLILVALLAAFFNPPDSGVTSGEFEYVQRVINGDTLMLGTGERVRLIGVNTPETVHPQKAVEAFGKEASAFTKRMAEGKLARLEFDPLSSRRSDGKDAIRGHLPMYSYKMARI
jgi:endonuclease YncB( thermonuclease family)